MGLKLCWQALALLSLIFSQGYGLAQNVSGHVNASVTANPGQLSVPPTPGFSLGQKLVKNPNQRFQLLNLLYLTNNLMKYYAVRPFNSVAPGQDIYIPKAGNLILGTARAPGTGPSDFLARYALWGLWKGTVKAIDERDFRTGRYEFMLEGVSHAIGGVVFQLEPVGATNAITATEDSESVLTSILDDADGQSQTGEEDLVATTKRSPAVAAANGNHTPNHLLYTPPATNATIARIFNNDYILILSDFGEPLNRLNIFTTIYESIVDRAAKPDRFTFLDRTYEYIASTGYRIGYRPHPESTIVPEYEAIIFGLTTLIDSMRQFDCFREMWFQVCGEGLVPIFDCYITGEVI